MINCQLSPTFFEEMDYRLPICTSGLDTKIHEIEYLICMFSRYYAICLHMESCKQCYDIKLELNEDSRFDMSRTSIMLRTAEAGRSYRSTMLVYFPILLYLASIKI